MIERVFTAADQRSRAWYSPCGRYRYGLERVWDGRGPSLLYVMLNPSTATEAADDPTIARCGRRARMLGFGGMRIANLFAWRATRPADLKRAEDPVGPDNDGLLRDWSRQCAMTLAAWGVHGAHGGRAAAVRPLLFGDVRHLGLTRDGHPRHPLYVPYSTRPEPFTPEPADA